MTAAEKPAGEFRLVIADSSGLAFVGWCELEGESPWMVIAAARCIVRWGTEEHAAQLIYGATKETVLGAQADATVRRDHVILSYLCDEKAWMRAFAAKDAEKIGKKREK